MIAERASSGKDLPKIFEELYGQHYPRLVAYFNGSLRCYQDAEDLAQETLTRVWEHGQKYLFQSAGNRAAIINCIARNLLRDRFRYQRVAPCFYSLDDIPSYVEEGHSFAGLIDGANPTHLMNLDGLIREEAVAMLRDKFKSHPFWQIWEQRLKSGANYQEMALKSGTPYTTFMSHVFRGRALVVAWAKRQGFEVSYSAIC